MVQKVVLAYPPRQIFQNNSCKTHAFYFLHIVYTNAFLLGTYPSRFPHVCNIPVFYYHDIFLENCCAGV